MFIDFKMNVNWDFISNTFKPCWNTEKFIIFTPFILDFFFSPPQLLGRRLTVYDAAVQLSHLHIYSAC